MTRTTTEALASLLSKIQLFFMCALALFVIGGVSRSQLNEVRGWDASTWYQLYTGPFIVESILKIVKGLLVLWFLGLICGSIFLGGFISKSGVFEPCTNNVTISSRDRRPCVARVEGATVACIIFFIICFLLILFTCDDQMHFRSKKPRQQNTGTSQPATQLPVNSSSPRISIASVREAASLAPTDGAHASLHRVSAPGVIPNVSSATDIATAPPRYSDIIKLPV